MKFFEKHRQDLLISFEKNNFLKDEFHFIKRKGRIIAHHRKTRKEFSFFEQKEIKLDETTGQFDDRIKFEVKSSILDKTFVENWEEVLNLLDDWLKIISTDQ